MFEFFHGSRVGRKTLASLARTCLLFSSPALDILWHDLDGFHPLLKILPIATYSVDNPQWLTFQKYAKRVKAFRGRVTAQESVSSFPRCPKSYLPLLPNLIELEWNQIFLAPNNSGIPLLRYLAGPTVTKVTLSFMLREYSSAELEALADLLKLCPNVTSFAIVPYLLWDREPPQEVGTMVAQWPRLRTLRICAIAQPVMDQLLSRQTLESLHINYYDSSPIYSGTIPATVHELTLRGDSHSLCTRFLKTMYASPTRFRILVAKDDEKEESDGEMFHLLPRRINTSRLLSLTIQSASSIQGIPTWQPWGSEDCSCRPSSNLEHYTSWI
ncbi:hypothetical protein L210DRAFT_3653804 [Boletus edulis BED1]|uniref:F-box domain-containing protein n=1 Tax=Boletus edulis BED1 TaxID=1328754 RepID=A0AAD4BEW9_BOLED|nr:hypothetical protein L210DRAFT_3653804 [Boletus edulis BED1]